VAEREKRQWKARESRIERERGFTCEGCERRDVRRMGRVCVRVSHKSCLNHFDLSVSIEQRICQGKNTFFPTKFGWSPSL